MSKRKLDKGYRFKVLGKEYELIELHNREMPMFASVRDIETGKYCNFLREDIPGYTEELEFVFTASSAKNDLVSSPKLDGHDGAKIYFTRFGLIAKSFVDYLSFSYDGKKGEPVKPDKEVPDIPGYNYHRKPIRDGYLYVYEEYQQNTFPDQYHEYRIDNGRLRRILWTLDNMGNIRQPSGDYIDFHKIPRNTEVMWVAYSEVQWSRKYASRLLSTESEEAKELRGKRFTKVSVVDWLNQYDFSGSHIFNDAVTVDDVVLTTEKLDMNDIGNPISRTIHHFEAYQKIDKFQTEINRKDKKKEGLTLYFTVHDPLGCVEDVSEDLALEYAKLDACIASASSPKSEEEILNETLDVMKNKFESDNYNRTSITQEEQDYLDLFSSGLTIYQLLFGSESLEKYQKKVQKEKLTKLLAIEERKNIHKNIVGENRLRDALGRILNSNYYQNVLIDYVENIDTNRLTGQLQCAITLNLLATLPEFRDAFMDIKNPEKESEREADRWAVFVYESFFYDSDEDLKVIPTFRDMSEPVQYVNRILLNKGIEGNLKGESNQTQPELILSPIVPSSVPNEIGPELADKALMTAYSILGLVGQINFNKCDKLDIRRKGLTGWRGQLTEVLNNLLAEKGSTVKPFEIQEKELKNLIHKVHGKKSIVRKYKSALKALRTEYGIKNAVFNWEISEVNRTISNVSGEIDNTRFKWIEHNEKAKFWDRKVAGSPIFSSFLLSLSIINLGFATKAVIEDENNQNRSVVNVAAAITELTSVIVSLNPIKDTRIGNVAMAKLLNKTTIRLSVQIGWLASLIGVVVSVMDAVERFDAKDFNASIAYMVAAVSGAVAVGASIASTSGVALAGPVGWIAFAVGLIAVIVAILITDDDLELFLEDTVFGKGKKINKANCSPSEMKRTLYEKREMLAAIYKRPLWNQQKLDINLRDFAQMREWLINLVTNFTVEMKFNATSKSCMSMRGVDRMILYRFRINCKFSYVKPGVSEFKYFLLIFPGKGKNNEPYICLESDQDKRLKNEDDNTLPIHQGADGLFAISMDFNSKRELSNFMKRGNKIHAMNFVLGCRIIIDEEKGEYWPFARDNKELYAAYYGSLQLPPINQSWNNIDEKYTRSLSKSCIFASKEEIVKIALNNMP